MKRLLLLSLMLLLLPVSSLAAQEDSFTVDTISLTSLGFGSALSPDDHTLALYDFFILYDEAPQAENLTIRMIDLRTGEETGSLSGQTDWVTGADFTSDGSQLVSFHRNGDLLLWDVAGQSLIKTISTYLIGGSSVQFLGDDRTVLLRFGEFTLALLNTETGAITRLFGQRMDTYQEYMDIYSQFPERGDLMISAWTLSPDEQWIAVSSANDEVFLYDIESGERTSLREKSEQFGRYAIRSLVFTSDSRELVYFDQNDEQFHVWDMNELQEIRTAGFGGAAFALAPDNVTVAWADRETGMVYLADATGENAPVEILQLPETQRVAPGITTLTFTSDGSQLIVGGLFASDEDNAIYVVNLTE